MSTQQPDALEPNTALRVAQNCRETGSDPSCPFFARVQLTDAAYVLERQHAENESLQQGYDAARLEIASLQAQLEAIGAGGVEPLRSKADSVLEDALSDAVRVPLDSLHADAAYLIGRLRDGSMPHARVIEIIRERIDAAKAAIRARAAHGQAPADAAPSAGAVAGPDDIDAIALTRYKVAPAHESMFHRFAVVAGDGKQQLYLGRETECQNMTRKFAGAFLDGAFYQSQIAAAPTYAAPQPAPVAQGDAEDAARYRYWRDHMITNDLQFLRVLSGALPDDVGVSRRPTAAEWDAAMDAAIAQAKEGGAA